MDSRRTILGPPAIAALLCLPVTGLLPAAGWSQQLEEIVVTARKREETLQDVPLSITAFGAQSLIDRNIQNSFDLARNTPNFQMERTLGRRLDAPIIRGQFSPLVGVEPSASFFVDGVFISGNAGLINVRNLERIEVLRGPQAALFGRATFSGAINYITRRPTEDYEVEVNLRAGEDEDYEAAVWGSGPLIKDKLYFFASAEYQSWDGEWRNNIAEGEVNQLELFPGVPTGCTPGVDCFFSNGGAGVWAPNVPKDGVPCPPGSLIAAGETEPGCPPQIADNTKLGGEETKSATLKLLFTPTETIDITLKGEWADADDQHYASLYVPPGGNLNCFAPQYDPANQVYVPSPGWFCGELKPASFTSKSNIPNLRQGVSTRPVGPVLTSQPAPYVGATDETKRLLLQFDWDLADDWLLTARATRADGDYEAFRDLERSPALGPVATGLFESGERRSFDDKSFELRLQTAGDGPWTGLIGYYYYNQEREQQQRNFNGFDNTDWFIIDRLETDNNAVFGSISYQFTDRWSLSLDARYASDDLTSASGDFDGNFDATCDPVAMTCTGEGVGAQNTFYSFTPRLTLTWQTTDDAQIYALVAKGNKPGGFNFPYFDARAERFASYEAIADGRATIEEEESWTWEIGAKTSWLENRLVFNLALFYIDWTNQAINTRDCVVFESGGCTSFLIVANAGESRVYGGELELNWQTTDNLFLGMGAGVADNQLEEYFDPELAGLQCNQWEWYDTEILRNGTPVNADCSAAGDASGQTAPRVPKLSVNLAGEYQRPLTSESEWFFKTYLNYTSKQYATVVNAAHTGDVYLWDARLGFQTDRWLVSFYVDNILDEDSPTLLQDFPVLNDTFATNAAQAIGVPPISPLAPAAIFEPVSFTQPSPSNVTYPTGFQLQPRRGTNYGISVQFRFGG